MRADFHAPLKKQTNGMEMPLEYQMNPDLPR